MKPSHSLLRSSGSTKQAGPGSAEIRHVSSVCMCAIMRVCMYASMCVGGWMDVRKRVALCSFLISKAGSRQQL